MTRSFQIPPMFSDTTRFLYPAPFLTSGGPLHLNCIMISTKLRSVSSTNVYFRRVEGVCFFQARQGGNAKKKIK